ncbi:hypothetical protein [Francisella sp. 19X1-34]|uniref:hypothetical protein n=1 Tax=Francisella sp. 19X1-34 TaxID=3087177 RepID=UPI002E30194C|nr:hypothetical protein [Francisella sp. 19X1-34]MED7789593.1 hypothetical protein [Francisella sp. 19X1-34]
MKNKYFEIVDMDNYTLISNVTRYNYDRKLKKQDAISVTNLLFNIYKKENIDLSEELISYISKNNISKSSLIDVLSAINQLNRVIIYDSYEEKQFYISPVINGLNTKNHYTYTEVDYIIAYNLASNYIEFTAR